MKHAVYRVTAFEIVGPYTLKLEFDDGACRTIDFGSVLKGELYGPLKDRALFDQVGLDPEAHTLVWPNGADFDPATLHDWPDIGSDFAVMAKGWAGKTGRSTDEPD